jgi:hypothetical protein
MAEHLLKCHKCGAVMVQEGYLQYGWYLDGKKVDACPTEAEPVQVMRKKWESIRPRWEKINTLPDPKA